MPSPFRLLGIILVLASAPAPAQTPTARLVPEIRIGQVDGPAAYTFSPDLALAVARDGSIFLLDREQRTVRRFDARGRHVQTFGGEGAGPGEFIAPYALGFRGDTLWVTDPLQMRVTFFRTDGRVVRTAGAVLRGTRDWMPAIPEHVLAHGASLVLPAAVEEPDGAAGQPVLHVAPTGQARTVDRHGLGNRMMRIELGSGRVSLSQPWDDTPLLAAAPDGSSFVTVHRAAATSAGEGRFRVTRFSPAGDTVYSRTYRYTPRRMPSGWRDTWTDSLAGFLARGPGIPRGTAVQALRRELYVPAHMPPVSAVLVGTDGTVWLRREDPGEGETVRWLVLDARGGVAASVVAPRELRAMQARRDAVWGITWDDLDVPYVVRYRVQPSRRR